MDRLDRLWGAYCEQGKALVVAFRELNMLRLVAAAAERLRCADAPSDAAGDLDAALKRYHDLQADQ